MKIHPSKKRPTDINQRAKLIVDIAIGDVENDTQPPKNPKKIRAGRLGGLKGGKARAKKLSSEERKAIALKAAHVRWDSQ